MNFSAFTLPGMAVILAATPIRAEDAKRIVASDGSAPFSSIQVAIDSVTDATRERPVEIVVKPGQYFEMFTTRDWVNVSGTDRDACIVTYNRKPEEPQHKTHVVWATSNSVIRNLTLVGKDVKYCIHSDGGRDYSLTVENCVLRRECPENTRQLCAAFGVGLRARQHIVVRNSRFEADVSLYFHNWDRQKESCSFTVEDSVLAGREVAIITHTLGSGQRDYLVLHDNELHGSEAAIRYVNTERLEPNPRKGADEIEIFGSGNNLLAPHFGAPVSDDAANRLNGIERAGGAAEVVAKPNDVQVPNEVPENPAAHIIPLAGNGDIFRLAGDGRIPFSADGAYPCVVDFDVDGRRDLIGSDRYGTGARVVWFRNVGTDESPVFSQRETRPLHTVDGKEISNPNRGWMLTPVICDWDGDGKPDLLVGGWCRFLTFHKNTGTPDRPVFAAGKAIFDAKIFPGLDYGKSEDTPYQGVFIEPCDWDGDGALDLLVGTYGRGRIFVLRARGRDENGLPVLDAPVALHAGGKEIDFLTHGRPSVGDWDGDGDLDLISGQYYGEETPARSTGAFGSYLFENTGSRTAPVLAAGASLRDAMGKPIWAGFHTVVLMVDWNRDGLMDVFASGMNGSSLYLNQGEAGQALLSLTPVPALGLAPCRVSNFAYPLAHDLDRDGTLDLVVGDGEGYVHFFGGVGDKQFAPPIKLKSGGLEINEVGCPDGGEAQLGYVKVAIADWDRDGFPDLIMWSNNGLDGWQGGSMGPDSWCLKFFPGTADPMNFGPPTEIRAEGQQIMAGYRSKPDVADLDGDGLPDLVVSCGNGTVKDPGTLMFFRNVSEGPDAVNGQPGHAPPLAAGVPLIAEDGKSITVPVRTAVRLADWDGDGDFDLFTAGHSPIGLRYWENTGNSTRPVFASGIEVSVVNDTVSSHHEIGVDVVALDGDGKPDLVIGNGDNGTIHYFKRSFLEGASKNLGIEN